MGQEGVGRTVGGAQVSFALGPVPKTMDGYWSTAQKWGTHDVVAKERIPHFYDLNYAIEALYVTIFIKLQTNHSELSRESNYI